MTRSAALFLLACALALAAPSAEAARVHEYRTERAARKHCPGDAIVWGSSRGIYYPDDSPHYGRGKGYRYACQLEAYRAGWRAKIED